MAETKTYTFKDFEEHCRRIAESTATLAAETIQQRDKRIKRLQSNYGLFFEYYFDYYAKAKCAWYHIYVAHLLLRFPVIFLILEWFRGSAKSIHANMGWPLFLWANGDLKCMVLLGQNETIAGILLSDIQAQFESNEKLKADYGPQMQLGSWEEGEFCTRNGAAFFARGMGQSTRGLRNGPHRPDYIVADDLDTEELSRNPKRIRDAVNWLNDGVLGTVDIGNQRFILVNNGPFANSILRSMVTEKMIGAYNMGVKRLNKAIVAAGAFTYHIKSKWHYMRVNAVDDDWVPSWPEKYTTQYWREFAADRSLRSWLREWQNTPIVEGGVFKPEWVQWKTLPHIRQYQNLICYCDPSYKDTGDYKACRMWGSYNTELHLIKSFVRQASRIEMISWLYDTYEWVRTRGGYMAIQIEGNFAQDDFLKDDIYQEGLRRGYQLPYTFDKRKKGDKFNRIESTSSHYQNGNVYWNEAERNSNDFRRGEEQLLAIEQGSKSPDDAPDADEGAMYYLTTRIRSKGQAPATGSINQKGDY